MSCTLYQHALAQAIKAGRGSCATSPHNYSIVHRQKASQHLFGVVQTARAAHALCCCFKRMLKEACGIYTGKANHSYA